MHKLLLIFLLVGVTGCSSTPVAQPAPNQFELLPASAKTKVEISDFQTQFSNFDKTFQERLKTIDDQLLDSLSKPTSTQPASSK